MDQLTVSSELRAGFTVIKVSGDLDFHTAGRLHAGIRDARRTHGQDIVFDLSGLVFMDSQGARVLANAWRYTAMHGGSVSLASVSDRVRQVLVLTGLSEQIPVYRSLDQALAGSPTGTDGTSP